jgi:hypothetical protein
MPEIQTPTRRQLSALFLDAGRRLYGRTLMAQPMTQPSQDPRAVAILAKNIYREFRAGGFSERDVMALAGELLSLVTTDVKTRQHESG